MKRLNSYKTIVGLALASFLWTCNNAQAQLSHRYSFSDAAGQTVVADSVGSLNGTLIKRPVAGADLGSDFADGQLTLANTGSSSNGTAGDYVDLPNALGPEISDGAFTIETWATIDTARTWQRYWDFGTSQGGEDTSTSGDLQANYFLTPNSAGGAGLRAEYRPDGGAPTALDAPGDDLNPGQEFHIVAVWDESTTSERLYLDGLLVAENNATTMVFANDFQSFANNFWLGRSQWGDPLASITYNEFRIYDDAVSSQAILDNFVDGPDETDGAGAGALSGVTIDAPAEMVRGTSAPVSVIGNFANDDIDVTLDLTTTLTSDDTGVVSVAGGNLTAVADGTATLTAEYGGQMATLQVTVSFNPTSLTIDLANTDIILGNSAQLAVLGDFSTGTGIDVTSAVTLTSSNAGVATVDEDGVITSVGEGTATITASGGGQSDSVEISVIPAPFISPMHRYTFSGAAGSTTVTDTPRAGVTAINGTLVKRPVNGADQGSDFAGGQLTLANAEGLSSNGAGGDYIDFPNVLAQDFAGGQMTWEYWTTWTGSGAWQRTMDMGTSTTGEDVSDGGGSTTQIFITPNGGGGYRAAWRPQGGGEQNVTRGGAPDNTEHHIALTWDEAAGVVKWYVDGALTAQNNNLNTTLATDFVPFANNMWLGRSQYPDPLYAGSYNEFRIYDGAAGPLQVAINAATGPDTFVEDPGAVTSLSIEAESTALSIRELPVGISLSAMFANVTGAVNVSSVPGVKFTSSDPNIVQVLENPNRLSPIGGGTATITATYGGQQADLEVTVSANVPALMLQHRYSFDGNANDSVGGANGTLAGGASIANGAVDLSGGITGTSPNGVIVGGWVDLPNFTFSDFYYLNNVPLAPGAEPIVTVEAFGTWMGGDAPIVDDQIVWDFGQNGGGEDYTFEEQGGADNEATAQVYAKINSNGTFEADVLAGVGSPNLNGPAIQPGDSFYVAVVYDAAELVYRMYVNGVLVDADSIGDGSFLGFDDFNVWIGRSNDSDNGAGLFQGMIDEVRIWTGFLTGADAALHYACGPDELTCEIAEEAMFTGVSVSSGMVTLEWEGDGVLEFTPTLPATTWTEISGATSPFNVDATSGDGGYYRINQQ